jgi:Tol biopolymer transport system component
MTSFERFENRIPMLLEELAVPSLPDYADDLFARTGATRQRPEWTLPERWLPMSAISRRVAVAPRIPWRVGVLVALLAVAALVAVLVAGSILNPRPAPYGPARNGDIVFVDAQGRVAFADPATGVQRVIADVTGASNPLVSLDGTRVAFLRQAGLSVGAYDLMVVNVDGTGQIQLSGKTMSAPKYFGWSGDGRQIVVVDSAWRMLLFGTREQAAPVNLSDLAKLDLVNIGLGYNYRSTAAFRPNGDEILFTSGGKLMAVRTDGSAVRTLLSVDEAGLAGELKGGEWSPDGSQVLFMVSADLPQSFAPAVHTYLVNADGTGVRPLSPFTADPFADQNSALWSPDGTRVAFQYWHRHATDDGQDFAPIQVVDVASGRVHPVGPSYTNGFVSWEWSPDGASILEVPGAENVPSDCSGAICTPQAGGSVLIINASTGAVTTVPLTSNTPVSWQRVAK